MGERYHATTQNRFYPDMSNVNKNITVEVKYINPPVCIYACTVQTYILMASAAFLKVVFALWKSLPFDMGLCFNSMQKFGKITFQMALSVRRWYFSPCMFGCLAFSTCFGQLCAHHQETSLYVTLVFFTLYGWLSGLLYMFRATMCPSSGELTVSMRHWYFSLCMVGCLVCWLG